MAHDSRKENVFNTVADDRHVEGGYQPRAQGPAKRDDLKPPKGGTAVEPPRAKDSSPPKA